MLFELGLPSCDTVLFNAKVRLTDSYSRCDHNVVHAFGSQVFRLDALALSVIATATWPGGWLGGRVAGCHTPVLYQNR